MELGTREEKEGEGWGSYTVLVNAVVLGSRTRNNRSGFGSAQHLCFHSAFVPSSELRLPLLLQQHRHKILNEY